MQHKSTSTVYVWGRPYDPRAAGGANPQITSDHVRIMQQLVMVMLTQSQGVPTCLALTHPNSEFNMI
jgi:hypothetical protein